MQIEFRGSKKNVHKLKLKCSTRKKENLLHRFFPKNDLNNTSQFINIQVDG